MPEESGKSFAHNVHFSTGKVIGLKQTTSFTNPFTIYPMETNKFEQLCNSSILIGQPIFWLD